MDVKFDQKPVSGFRVEYGESNSAETCPQVVRFGLCDVVVGLRGFYALHDKANVYVEFAVCSTPFRMCDIYPKVFEIRVHIYKYKWRYFSCKT